MNSSQSQCGAALSEAFLPGSEGPRSWSPTWKRRPCSRQTPLPTKPPAASPPPKTLGSRFLFLFTKPHRKSTKHPGVVCFFPYCGRSFHLFGSWLALHRLETNMSSKAPLPLLGEEITKTFSEGDHQRLQKKTEVTSNLDSPSTAPLWMLSWINHRH